MKLYKNAVILFFAAVLLLIVYLIIGTKSSNNNSETENKINIITLDTKNITEVDIYNKKDTFVYKKIKNTWKLTDPSDIKYDQAVADGLPLCIYYAAASKKVCDNAKNLEQYGLKGPSEVTLKTNDGKQNVLEIGNLNSTKDSYYVKLNSSNAVYVMDKNKIEALLLTRNIVKDKNVLSFRREFRPKMLAQDIKEVTLEKNGTLVFSAKKDAATGNWTIVSPIEANADKNKITPVLNAISKVLALEFIDDSADNYSKYGLKNPAYSIEFKNSQGTKKLYIGNEKEKDSEYYARVEGSNDVFSIDEEGFNFLDRPLREYIQK